MTAGELAMLGAGICGGIVIMLTIQFAVALYDLRHGYVRRCRCGGLKRSLRPW